MAAPTPPNNLFANNHPPSSPHLEALPLPQQAQGLLYQARTRILQLTDSSPVQDWVAAVSPLGVSTHALHPAHRQHPQANRNLRLQVATRALCYANEAARTFCHNRAQLPQTERQTENSHTHLLSHWNTEFLAQPGWAGLVASPVGGLTFQGSGAPWAQFQAEVQQPRYRNSKAQADTLLATRMRQWRQAGGYYANWHCCGVYILNRRV